MTFADHFSVASESYAKFRPRYPDALFDFLADAAAARDDAWDAGTGTGQAAIGLARLFDHVTATDPSTSQIERAGTAAHRAALSDDRVATSAPRRPSA